MPDLANAQLNKDRDISSPADQYVTQLDTGRFKINSQVDAILDKKPPEGLVFNPVIKNQLKIRYTSTGRAIKRSVCGHLDDFI